jgi:hypothetical protein
MSLIAKRDASILLAAGFSEEELGFVESGMQGVEIYETPDDYFAHELITNACESGECSLMDEPKAKDDVIKERYDDSRPGLYDDHEYDGNEDYTADIPVNLREQCEWLKTIKLGKMSIWQRRNKNGNLEWPVKNLKICIPEDDQDRFNRLPKDLQKDLWKSYARDQWKNLWGVCAASLREYEIEDKISFTAKTGTDLNIMVISADNVRKMGFDNLPAEARWISMIYFVKDVR